MTASEFAKIVRTDIIINAGSHAKQLQYAPSAWLWNKKARQIGGLFRRSLLASAIFWVSKCVLGVDSPVARWCSDRRRV